MRFLRLLRKELSGNAKGFWTLIVLAALSSALILVALNYTMVTPGVNKLIFAGIFVILLAGFVILQYKILNKGWDTAEKISDGFRKRLSSKILSADLAALEKIGDREIYERLTQETAYISQSAGFLIPSLQTIILMFFVVIYLAIIFPIGMAVFTVLILVGFYYYRRESRTMIRLFERATKSEVRFYGFLNDILKGIKELKLFKNRKTEFLSDVKSTSSFLRKLKQKSLSEYADLSIYSQAFFFLVVGITVFIIPKFNPASIPSIIKLVTTTFFVMGPVIGILFIIPMIEKMDLSLEFLQSLEKKLDAISEKVETKDEKTLTGDFEKITVNGLTFDYNDPNNGEFKITPVNLEINKGEVVFFVGGNGSGKTTLLKVISSLYKKTGGNITLNNIAVNVENLDEYRNYFSAIFSDFHLFAKLYGFSNPNKHKIRELLEIMRIENKTTFNNDSFSSLNLSTGQKKRLALVVSLLEDKPIMIFDEWAAEQDQHFREYFYDNILAELKLKGKTVLVVSHDERYFGIADKVVKMDFGKVTEVKIN